MKFLVPTLAFAFTLLLGGLGFAAAMAPPEAALDLDFLDIGQGDAILVTTPSGRRLLVDTGPDETVLRQQLQEVLPQLQKHIDILLLSHSDKDHIGGAAMVLQEYTVGLVLVNQEAKTPPEMQAVLDTAAQMGVPVVRAHREQDIRLDDETLLDILTPPPDFETATQTANNNSIVGMLITPWTRILLTGDAEEDTEKALLEAGTPLEAPWLKGGHHGSKTSTSSPFLQAARPRTVFFQNGKDNSYGHPAKEVMDRLAAAQIPVYNTSIEGRVHLRCPRDSDCILTPQLHGNGP